ncbi:hypothetical protein C1T14_26515, partial [Escherichia coli]
MFSVFRSASIHFPDNAAVFIFIIISKLELLLEEIKKNTWRYYEFTQKTRVVSDGVRVPRRRVGRIGKRAARQSALGTQ